MHLFLTLVLLPVRTYQHGEQSGAYMMSQASQHTIENHRQHVQRERYADPMDYYEDEEIEEEEETRKTGGRHGHRRGGVPMRTSIRNEGGGGAHLSAASGSVFSQGRSYGPHCNLCKSMHNYGGLRQADW
ncbi:hypothetical protein Y032_0026g1435 [Ancylostoma ceylanicum]|uniref:Secreted protein n=1 Tax=Ancylostoma ceylanicum TaxID=53326 RepID=A0A016UUM3_9BILA|nr:hypothetical protein Y032_0026g1435 [Ancylostoma ceylanicum]